MANYSPGDIVLSWNYTETRCSLPSTLRITVHIKQKRDMSKILRTAFLSFAGDSHFQACKEYVNGQTYVPFSFRYLHAASIENFPSTIMIELRDQAGAVLERSCTAMDVGHFTKDFFANGRETPRNIMLFGLAGSAKSSFINSCYSLLSKNVQLEMAQSGGNGERVTRVLKSYRLLDVDSKEPTRYRLWDTWGLERTNYKNTEFGKIIQGHQSSGWKMEDSHDRLGDLDPNKVPSAKDVQHCVIFVIPAAELQNQEGDLLKITVEYMETATTMGISSVLAITKIDQLVPEYRSNPFGNHKEVTTLINQAAQIFALPQNRIVPLINYVATSKKDFEIDRVIWKLLSIATSVADASATRRHGEKSAVDQELEDLINS